MRLNPARTAEAGSSASAADTRDAVRRIYLICDGRDSTRRSRFADCLFERVRGHGCRCSKATKRRCAGNTRPNLGGMRRGPDLLRRRQRALAHEQAARAQEDRRIRPRQADARDGACMSRRRTPPSKQRFRTHEAIVINPGRCVRAGGARTLRQPAETIVSAWSMIRHRQVQSVSRPSQLRAG